MALKDVFRDTGSDYETYIQAEILVKEKLHELEAKSNEELWKIYVSESPHSPLSLAIKKILKIREPEKFFH